ncbi:Oidioi.mRNA.OKI2018_I69.chr2.g7981.t1.cds [Oikopleura dioica]|uniref:Oidioi.mRNA.OKI2018_I69.chr2.g7981.t1.cds n=1 Tax=Oikopleura dioica TaxID=34765 RepID=A0ABN7TG75_OIKDI|nr:Oidioi.mRNA.OKI2018_I69.chr2.g7981.t1.cds [Oikopleura dioica]
MKILKICGASLALATIGNEVPDMAPEFPPGTFKYFSVEFASSVASSSSSKELQSAAQKYYSALGFGVPRFELSDSLRLFSYPGLLSGQIYGEPLCPFAECVLGDFSICTEDEDFYKPICRSPCATGFCSDDARCMHPSATVSPKCFCLGAASSLTFGNSCEYSLPLWLLLIGTTFLVLAVLCLAAYALKNSAQQKSQRLSQYIDERGHARVELAPS